MEPLPPALPPARYGVCRVWLERGSTPVRAVLGSVVLHAEMPKGQLAGASKPVSSRTLVCNMRQGRSEGVV